MYVEIVVGSSSRKFTGSGTSMRKAKQAAASLALNEVGFKQFKTKQSRVEVGEDSSKAKVVEQIVARSQREITGKSQGGGKISRQGSLGPHLHKVRESGNIFPCNLWLCMQF